MTATEVAAADIHPQMLDLADDIVTLVSRHPKALAVEALSHVVGLMCLTKSRDESRASLADFMSAAEARRDTLEEVLANKKAL